MKKYFILLVAALSLAACEKEKEVPVGNKFVKYTPASVKLDRTTGGKVVVTAGVETYPAYVVPIKLDDNSMEENVVYFWENRKPTTEEFRRSGVYEALGCKITLSDDLKQYTIEVEEGCEWDYLEVWTNWMDGYPVPSKFHIVLNPELYDYFRE